MELPGALDQWPTRVAEGAVHLRSIDPFTAQPLGDRASPQQDGLQQPSIDSWMAEVAERYALEADEYR